MSEETKERLSKTEYEKVGEMLLELIAECPFVPEELLQNGRILYDDTDSEAGIFILTDGGRIKKKYVSGTFIAAINIRIIFQGFPTTNIQRINAQNTVDGIKEWFDNIKTPPKLTGGRTITKFEASGSYPAREDAEENKSVAFMADVAMEYQKKGDFKNGK